ncbi:hypothetical protein N9T80_00355 [bacterium]|nr:hypothetical protein [bacterium]
MEEINVGEIVYTTITLKDEKNKIHELRKVVFSRNWDCEYPILRKEHYSRFLTQNNVKKSDATVVDVIIHARTGFKHKSKGFTTAKKNEQIRDTITGAYV